MFIKIGAMLYILPGDQMYWCSVTGTTCLILKIICYKRKLKDNQNDGKYTNKWTHHCTIALHLDFRSFPMIGENEFICDPVFAHFLM